MKTVGAISGLLAMLAASAAPSAAADAPRTIVIDAGAPARPFPHNWEQMIGSGRAALTLRATWRRDLRAVASVTGIRYVRFHAILHDELGVYDEDAQGHAKYNFQYVDQIYDGLLANGMKPLVELSFMPRKLAARPDTHVFWYQPIVSPPKSDVKWDALITALARHLVERYGIDEVASWYFEVWNEPNIDFWTGRPAQSTYFELYDHTARALKAVDPRLRVGGPATAAAQWVPDFIDHTSKRHVPVDFVSTHVYGDDPAELVLGPGKSAPAYGMACPAMRRVRGEIAGSSRPDLPLLFTEANVSSGYTNPITQGRAVGTWLAETVARCADTVDTLALWAISDVFEEQGVMPHPFAGGFGIIAQAGIPKPAFTALALMHKLGTRRIDALGDVIATRRDDGSLAVLAWNRAAPTQPPRDLVLDIGFKASPKPLTASVTRLDRQHADTLHLYEQMGSPIYPSPQMVERLREAVTANTPERQMLNDGVVHLSLPPDGMALIEVAGPGPGEPKRPPR